MLTEVIFCVGFAVMCGFLLFPKESNRLKEATVKVGKLKGE